jgi:hypothetical protein
MLFLGEHNLLAIRKLVGLFVVLVHVDPNGVPFTESYAFNGQIERDLAICFGNLVSLNNESLPYEK